MPHRGWCGVCRQHIVFVDEGTTSRCPRCNTSVNAVDIKWNGPLDQEAVADPQVLSNLVGVFESVRVWFCDGKDPEKLGDVVRAYFATTDYLTDRDYIKARRSEET